MFIQTEVTPNPATLKFLPGRTVLGKGTMEFTGPDTAGRSPLAVKLFAVHGVTGVFYGSDFVTVTKDDSDWQHLKPAILGVDHGTLHVGRAAVGGRRNREWRDQQRRPTLNSSMKQTPRL